LGVNTWVWREWQQVTNSLECWGIEGEIPPPTVTLNVPLGDINDYATYAACENNAEKTVEAEAAIMAGDGFTEMGDEGGGGDGGDPCSITNLTQPFFITGIQSTTNGTTITWQSCPMFRYRVMFTDALSTNDTVWSSLNPRYYVWGQANTSATSWTDMATTNISQRFYKVQRILSSPVAAGSLHSLAVRPDGTLWAWGDNRSGRIGDGITGGTRTIPEPIGTPQCDGGMSNVVATAGGADYSLAVDVNGTVWTWGANDSGQLGNGSASPSHSPLPSSIVGVSNVVAVAAGSYHARVLRADGTVWAWGNNADGELGVAGLVSGQTNSPVQSMLPTQIVAIAAGDSHSVALDKHGAVWTWGAGGSGRLGNGNTTNLTVPTLLTNFSNVMAIAAGYDHTVALTTNQTMLAWGNNDSGQLGDGSTMTRLTPVPVSGLSNVVATAAGYRFTLAATSNGNVYAWGDNSYGQLGTNGVSSLSTPQIVRGISNAVLVGASAALDISQDVISGHSLAVTVDQGTRQYWAWGHNISGEVGNRTTTDQYAPAMLHFCPVCDGCIQLGTNGAFVAPCTGSLRLFINDEIYADNPTNAYTVTISGLGQVNVPSDAANGVVIGIVSNGVTYSYSATGLCFFVAGDLNTAEDASGNGTNGLPHGCPFYGSSQFVCPASICYSLVGRIE
jgi:alpha-tubulin suppressor-like RCC1 family protein